MEADVYIWRYALLVLHARKERRRRSEQSDINIIANILNSTDVVKSGQNANFFFSLDCSLKIGLETKRYKKIKSTACMTNVQNSINKITSVLHKTSPINEANTVKQIDAQYNCENSHAERKSFAGASVPTQ